MLLVGSSAIALALLVAGALVVVAAVMAVAVARRELPAIVRSLALAARGVRVPVLLAAASAVAVAVAVAVAAVLSQWLGQRSAAVAPQTWECSGRLRAADLLAANLQVLLA